ncbi:MAG: RIO1 family regulatory kinase/ATPase [Desulfurococcaceae archaeon]
MVKIALIYKSLLRDDFRVLSAIERAHARREYVTLQILEKLSGFHEEKLLLVLSKLHELGLIKGETISGEKAYRLTYLGYDMLAIRALVNRNVIEAMGDKVGEGKESEIYLALAPGNVQVAVKFLRIGRTSFRQTVRRRTWTSGLSLPWYKQSRIAAEREFKALKELSTYKAYVPTPLGYNRHVVVIEYIDGLELYRKPPLKDPEAVLLMVLDTIATAYHKASIVHGDLSEYNILVRKQDEVPFIIDWPQYVYRDDPQAVDLLKRDVSYVVKFFSKTYGVELKINEALDYVVKWSKLNT